MLCCVLLLGLSGCATVGWYAQAARGQMELLSKREDIADLLDDPATSPELARRLETVLAARAFAVESLHLPDNRSYTLYADLGRDAVLWNVIAAPAFSLQPKQWCYPIAGCVGYRGYFREARARALADRLAADGWDSAIAPVPAYSTLGRFADPVLNTMLVYDDDTLVALIFHELAHQRLYVPGDMDFNESYASFVEQAGLARWLEVRGQDERLQRWRERQVRARAFQALVMQTRDELATLYASELDDHSMRQAKQAAFDRLRERHRAFQHEWRTDHYSRWMEQPLNNAHLALFSAYQAGTHAFAVLFDALDGDFARFHAMVEQIAAQGAEARRAFLRDAVCGVCPPSAGDGDRVDTAFDTSRQPDSGTMRWPPN